MFKVSKTIYFNYGHRLLGGHDKCSRLHGHSARVEIEMTASPLDRCGMVMNFFDIRKTIGVWIDQHLDHRTILSRKDPLVKVLREAGESVVKVDGNPTAEALAKWRNILVSL